MSTAVLQRTTFETSRDSEYFNVRELQAQTGQPAEMFVAVALKELADSALDACETAGIAPCLGITIRDAGSRLVMCVADNGTGIPPETVRRILNFQTRTSDKAVYRSPTRGAQGNALKTVLGMPCAFGVRVPVVIEARGIRHEILAWVDPAGELRIEQRETAITPTAGTRIEVAFPSRSWRCDPRWWGQALTLFNPHASVKIRQVTDESEHMVNMAIAHPRIFTNPRTCSWWTSGISGYPRSRPRPGGIPRPI
jgi:DNA topoisomerase VI subunit B